MMRAAPPAWTTAASWSGARSAPEVLDMGGASDPCSMATAWSTGRPSTGSVTRTGPPSSHAPIPSRSTTSAAPPNTAPSATARSTSPHFERLGIACVDGVRPHEMVQLVTVERESRTQLVRGPALDGRRRGVIDQFDHDAMPFEGGRSQTLDGGQGLAHGCRVDADPFASTPVGRRIAASGDDDVAPQQVRTSPERVRRAREPGGVAARLLHRSRRRPDRDVPRQPVGRPARCAPSTV